jgi:hypothetical protein
MIADDRKQMVEANKAFYLGYWAHRWNCRLRYDTQIKKDLFLFAAWTNQISFIDKNILDIGFGQEIAGFSTAHLPVSPEGDLRKK